MKKGFTYVVKPFFYWHGSFDCRLHPVANNSFHSFDLRFKDVEHQLIMHLHCHF
jgi:hypothetical protein